MKSIILISPSDKEITNLYEQWNSRNVINYIDNNKLNLIINEERIYIECCDLKNEYENEELEYINITVPIFYLISYSDINVMSYFIQNSIFAEGSYIDNDFGDIQRISDLRKKDISNFIHWFILKNKNLFDW